LPVIRLQTHPLNFVPLHFLSIPLLAPVIA
jgi:hypothetical protein